MKKNFILILLSLLAANLVRAEDKKDDSAPKPTPAVTSNVVFMNNMDALNDKRKLGVGDVLSLRVVEDEDAPHSLVITDSGEMETPYIGRVEASGKTCKQLAYNIKGLLEKQYYYKATVIIGLDTMGIKNPTRGKIYLRGQVRSEGAMDLPVDEVITVSKAIMRGGGFGPYANKRKVKVMRPAKDGQGDASTIIVDCVEILDKGKTSMDIVVEPDDVIDVPEKLINVL